MKSNKCSLGRWRSQKHGKNTKIKPSCEYLCEFEDNPSISMSSKILVKIHAVLRKLCPCALLAHVPYCPCALLPMCPIPQGPPSLSPVSTNIHFTHVSYCPCALLPMCPIAHVPYFQRCQKDVKLSKRCQVVKKMSNVKKSNT